MTNPSSTPGWYPDPSGAPRQRYFDGRDWTDWTDHYAPLGPQLAGAPVPQKPQPQPSQGWHVDLSAQPGDWIPQYQSPPTPVAHPPRQMVVRGLDTTIHFVLTLLTCGLWLPVWIIVAITGKRTIEYK